MARAVDKGSDLWNVWAMRFEMAAHHGQGDQNNLFSKRHVRERSEGRVGGCLMAAVYKSNTESWRLIPRVNQRKNLPLSLSPAVSLSLFATPYSPGLPRPHFSAVQSGLLRPHCQWALWQQDIPSVSVSTYMSISVRLCVCLHACLILCLWFCWCDMIGNKCQMC